MATLFTNVVRPAFGALLLFTCMAATLPGGFQLRVEAPRSGDAVLLVRTYGCNQPSKAKVTGTAEGLVRGERRSVPLKLKAVGAGVYSVERQWPAEGVWVLALTGTYRKYVSSVLVDLDADGKAALPRADEIRILRRKLSAADVEGALQKLTVNQTPRARKVKTL